MNNELKELEKSIDKIAEVAKGFGLDFYPVRFEICPADIIYTFGAYGMPTRFSHWSFGKSFHKMKMQYDLNLSRIYELVINANPCYAFLLEGNSLIQNKLVIAHVFAHCDFFKNNASFGRTNRGMVESMAVSAERIRKMEFDYGRPEVERILDAAISIQEHVDNREFIDRERKDNKADSKSTAEKKDPYEDLFALDQPTPKVEEAAEKVLPKPQKDLLKYIMKNSKYLKEWQREILAIIRDEMLYFYPQMETKIMNEGWASYWHARILRELDLPEAEAIDFAIMHAGVIQPSRMINPYYLGYKIWEGIEKRWNEPGKDDKEVLGLKGGEGRAKMFEVREMENDVSFIRNYLTRDIIEELDMFSFQKVGNTWQVTEKDSSQVRDNLATSLFNCGYPYIVVEDGDYNRSGELLLLHCHEGVDLDIQYLERTLPNVYTLWGRGVHLSTIVDGKPVLYSFSGERVIKTLR
jgi:stage V sporulation protein R